MKKGKYGERNFIATWRRHVVMIRDRGTTKAALLKQIGRYQCPFACGWCEVLWSDPKRCLACPAREMFSRSRPYRDAQDWYCTRMNRPLRIKMQKIVRATPWRTKRRKK